MDIVRPVRLDDLDAVVGLAEQASCGLSTLPPDRDLLAIRIRESVRCTTSPPPQPTGERFLFVLEELATGRLLGTTGIATKVGGFEPWYTYGIGERRRHSSILNRDNTVHYLELRRIHNGPSEIGTLFLLPGERGAGRGRLLSLSRFLFLAEYPDCFASTVVAEMRGVIDDRDCSPFWDAVGSHFFGVELRAADLMATANKAFIEELMPSEAIFIELLPPAAREVIGRVHPQTEPALHLLEAEGFRPTGEIDIFEGGPTVACPRDEIRTVRESRRARVAHEPAGDPRQECIVAKVASPDCWRVARGQLQPLDDETVALAPELQELLAVAPGATVRYTPLAGGTPP